MKRLTAFLGILCLMITLGMAAGAEEYAPFWGWFDHTSYMRSEPRVQDTFVKAIPENTPVYMQPVNAKYAWVEYEGATGYIYYPSALPMPAETAVEPYVLFSSGSKYVYGSALQFAVSIGQLPPETPVTVIAETDRCFQVRCAGWEEPVYLHRRDMQTLGEDRSAEGLVWADGDADALALPLQNSEKVGRLSGGRLYLITGENRGYYRLQLGLAEGYVRKDRLKSAADDMAHTAIAATVPAGTPVYNAPAVVDVLLEVTREARLMVFDGVKNGFYRLPDGGYVDSGRTEAVIVRALDASALYYAERETPLLLAPGTEAEEAGARLPAATAFTPEYAYGDYLLVRLDGVWGYCPKAAVQQLTMGEMMNRTAAVTETEALAIGRQGEKSTVAAGTKLVLERAAGDFYQYVRGNETGFIPVDAIRIVGSDIPIAPYDVTIDQDISLMDFPDSELADEAGVIEAGSRVTVSAVNRCYLLVTDGRHTGYAAQQGLLSAETEGIPTTEEQAHYEIVLDKESRMAYILLLNEAGERTGDVVMSARVAIGKRTTPTPSGSYTLGVKERWHRYTRSYTPYTTTYMNARFIHGIPCYRAVDGTTIVWMGEQMGHAVTGGCMRSPDELARFIYFYCPSYQTPFTVVGGGFTESLAAEREEAAS